jgi:BMFP domain-containing protein YqiC
LISAVLAGAKLIEVDELEARIERLEAALSSRSREPADEPGSALLDTA